jgi:hypothetical protein
MAFEELTGLGVLQSYGPRVTDGKWGASTSEEVIKHVVYEVDGTDLSSTTVVPPITGLDHIFPTGVVFLRAVTVGEVSLVGPTAVTIGTYLASDGTTAVDADGLVTAAAGTAATLAANYYGVGTGAQLAAGAVVTTAPTVIRVMPTVAVGTAGRFKLYVSYIAPTA